MNKPPTRPSGLSAHAKFCKWVWDSIVRLSGAEDEDDVESEDKDFQGAKQFVLRDATHPHYFVCRRFSISATGVVTIGHHDVKIIKPFHLRRSEFDRDELDPGETYDVQVEAVVGLSFDPGTHLATYSSFGSARRRYSYQYLSSTYRIATDQTSANPDDWRSETQTIIPRWVPAVLENDIAPGSLGDEVGVITTSTIAPTLIYAVHCGGLGANVEEGSDETLRISLIALNDGWAWAKTTA